MAKLPSLFLSDEEMGKKDDDHRAEKKGTHAGLAAWTPARIPPLQPRRFLKRLIILAVVAILVYEFIDNMPTDVPIRDRRHPQYGPVHLGRPPAAADLAGPGQSSDAAPLVSVDRTRAAVANEPARAAHDYKGPVKFPRLTETLLAIGETRGSYPLNKNVLFAAASLQSAATLLPIACQMGLELRSYVHFVLFGRSDILPTELLKVNGIDESCHIISHDARPNFASISTENRLGEGVAKAFLHLYNYMHPQAVIVDSDEHEEAYFSKGLRKQAAASLIPVIELPAKGVEKLSWMTKLDSQSLKAWNDLSIDILIHAAPGGSGNLMRLLTSLGAADYFSSPPPHITIELPHDVDASTSQFLQRFRWPPLYYAQQGHRAPQLSVRHRIPRKGMNEEDSAVRFLESFWPARPSHSHVLVLSPNAELSPNYFHYLKYTILAYKYSITSQAQSWDSRLFGFSLELPSSPLGGSGTFKPPQKPGSMSDGPSVSDRGTSFLWEAPNSNAMLIMGDKWVEIHEFVSRLLDLRHSTTETPRLLAEKLVSKRHPAWLEQALMLGRARGYLTLYPSQSTSSQLVAVHTETYQPPEEYEVDVPKGSVREGSDPTDGQLTHARGPLLDTLPDGGLLPGFYDLPMVSWDGAPTNPASLEDLVLEYATEFRQTVGGCVKSLPRNQRESLSASLFCTE